MCKEEQSQDIGPWIQCIYNENIQVTEKVKDRSWEQVIEYYCVAYLSWLTFFISMHLFTLFKRKIRVHREFLLPWEEIYLFIICLKWNKTKSVPLSTFVPGRKHPRWVILSERYSSMSQNFSKPTNSSWNQPSEFCSAWKFILLC